MSQRYTARAVFAKKVKMKVEPFSAKNYKKMNLYESIIFQITNFESSDFVNTTQQRQNK